MQLAIPLKKISILHSCIMLEEDKKGYPKNLKNVPLQDPRCPRLRYGQLFNFLIVILQLAEVIYFAKYRAVVT